MDEEEFIARLRAWDLLAGARAGWLDEAVDCWVAAAGETVVTARKMLVLAIHRFGMVCLGTYSGAAKITLDVAWSAGGALAPEAHFEVEHKHVGLRPTVVVGIDAAYDLLVRPTPQVQPKSTANRSRLRLV